MASHLHVPIQVNVTILTLNLGQVVGPQPLSRLATGPSIPGKYCSEITVVINSLDTILNNVFLVGDNLGHTQGSRLFRRQRSPALKHHE